jgi:hypothetical protein
LSMVALGDVAMNRLGVALIVCVSQVAPATVSAEPTAFYDPVNGSVKILNDGGQPLVNVSIVSTSGALGDASDLLPVPGALSDDSELPFAYHYLNFPSGLYDIGNAVAIGTLVSDLEFYFRASVGPLFEGRVVEIPEPASLLLAILSILGAMRCRSRRLPEA